MTTPLWIPMPGNEAMAASLAAAAGGEMAEIEIRRFPDDESYLRLRAGVSGRSVAIVCSLDRPDGKFLPLAFAAATARDLGAARVGLVAPYLAYMRQDRRFKEGEAVTSAHFARLISSDFDWLVTVDPHLHRYASLDHIYTIPNRLVHAGPALSDWIRHNVTQPLIVGPDLESAQWVNEVATVADCPHVVLAKRRLGDRDVEIVAPDLSVWQSRTPVLVDDIIASARTMIESTRVLVAAGLPKPVCVGVHALFSDEGYRALSQVAARVVTTNCVAHESNEIDLCPPVAAAVTRMTGA